MGFRRRNPWESDYVPPDRSPAPKLVPIFGSSSFTPLTQCQDVHPEGIPRQSRCCCMVCNSAGAKIERRVADHTFEGDGHVRPEAETEWPDFTPPEEPKFRSRGAKRATP